MNRSPCTRALPLAFLLAALPSACEADLHFERPGDPRRAPTRWRRSRSPPIPSSGQCLSTARPPTAGWSTARCAVTRERSYPSGPEEAARQFLRALAQTGSSTGTIGVGASDTTGRSLCASRVPRNVEAWQQPSGDRAPRHRPSGPGPRTRPSSSRSSSSCARSNASLCSRSTTDTSAPSPATTAGS
jgi:hypothetical protein